MRKKKGSIDAYLPLMVVIVVMFAVTTQSLDFFVQVSEYNNVHQIARKYLLKSETFGYLDDSRKNSMLSELSALGIKNIDLSGTTSVKGNAGDDIFVCVSYDSLVRKIEFKNGLPVGSKAYERRSVTRSSTAKH